MPLFNLYFLSSCITNIYWTVFPREMWQVAPWHFCWWTNAHEISNPLLIGNEVCTYISSGFWLNHFQSIFILWIILVRISPHTNMAFWLPSFAHQNTFITLNMYSLMHLLYSESAEKKYSCYDMIWLPICNHCCTPCTLLYTHTLRLLDGRRERGKDCIVTKTNLYIQIRVHISDEITYISTTVKCQHSSCMVYFDG